MPAPERRLAVAAALALGLVLAVVFASAAIRLGASVDSPSAFSTAVLRIIHRSAASLEVAVVAWLGWMAWRARGVRPVVFRAALLGIGLSAFLSVVGIAAGQNPPPAGAAANLLGGLALTALFAWLLGTLNRHSGQAGLTLASTICVLLAIQLALGAWLSIVDRPGIALPVHALLAMALAALVGWVGLARARGPAGRALFALALAAPIAGFTSLHYDDSAGAALIHTALAAMLLASTAYALGRGA